MIKTSEMLAPVTLAICLSSLHFAPVFHYKLKTSGAIHAAIIQVSESFDDLFIGLHADTHT